MAIITRERWRVLEPLLDHALDLSSEEQATWLEELRTSSPELAADLVSLLSGERVADLGGFLVEPLDLPLSNTPLAGVELGAYTLERPLGEGGMGSVWLARRTDGRYEGRAAVKLLNVAFLSARGQQRFRREGSLLARLTHPGIARLLDAGVAAAGGQPYLVLEFVEGQPIDAFANQKQLTCAERVRLVLQVLAAVGHAHANLIVHRDLKPSNILVTSDGSTRLLDFGIAKLLAAEGDEPRTELTVVGGRALTPEFAAPEQVRGGAITTATDIYAVGVILYTLLTGRRPYDLGERSAAEIERVVCEIDPPRPSATFTDSADANSDAAERARARGGTPDRLHKELRRDLDAIVLKALRKEPERRYSGVAPLTDDLERYLDGRPVLARPDSAVYRLRKFAGRHKAGVAIAAAAVLLLSGFAVRERTLRARAEGEARKSKAVQDYLVSVFDIADPFAPPTPGGSDATARDLIDRGEKRIDAVLAGQPDVQGALRNVLGRVYTNLGLYDKAAQLLQRSLDQRRSLLGPRNAEVAEAMDQLGVVLTNQNQLDRAEPLLREALAQRRALLGNADTATAESINNLATMLQEKNDFAAAEPLFQEALAIQKKVHGPDHRAVGISLNNLALLYYLKGEYDKAEPLYREALQIVVSQFGPEHVMTSHTMQNLANVEASQGRLAHSESLYWRSLAIKRKALGNAHPSVTISLNNLGSFILRDPRRADEAEPLIREALALDRQIFGEKHSYVAESLANLGSVLRAKGDFKQAEQINRQVLDMNRSLFGNEHTRVANNLNSIGLMLMLQTDYNGAIPFLKDSRAMMARLLGENHPTSAAVSSNLGRALRLSGRSAEAESVFRSLSSGTENKAVLRTPYIAAQVGLGRSWIDQGRAADALPVLERALELSRAQFKPGDWRIGETQLALGACLLALRRYERAEQVLREAATTLNENRKAQPGLAREADQLLARVINRQQA